MLAALSRAGVQLAEPKYLEAAARTFALVKKEFVTTATGDLRRVRGSTSAGTPADYAALALGCREFSHTAKKSHDADVLATQLLARANQLFLDAADGRYFAQPVELPVGIFARAPAAVDLLSAEALALEAGVSADIAKSLIAGITATLENAPTPAGDTLLALALAQPAPAK